MKRLYILLIGILFINYGFYGQLPTAPNLEDDKGKRQGDWVIYYDAEWEEIEDTSNVEFYRQITYIDDKPNGIVTDYYSTGIKQWEGELISDRPDSAHGVSIWFEDGIPSKELNYRNNIPHGKFVLRNNLGQSCLSFDFNQGEIDYNSINVFKKDSIILDYLNDFSERFHQLGDLKNSIDFKEIQCNIIKEKMIYDTDNYFSELNKLGILYSKNSEFSKALKLKLETINYYQQIGDTTGYNYGILLDNVGINYNDLGDHKKAYNFQLKAIKLIHKGLGKNHPSYVTSMNNLASTAISLMDENYDNDSLYDFYSSQALKYYELCLEIVDKESIDYARQLDNISVLYSKLKKFELALSTSIKAIKIFKELIGENHIDYIIALNNIALRYYDLGQFMECLQIQKRSLEIQEKVFGKYTLQSVNNLVYTCFKIGDFRSALTNLQKSYDLIKKSYLNVEKTFNSSLTFSTYNSLFENFSNMFYTLHMLEDLHEIPKWHKKLNKKLDHEFRNQVYENFIFLKGRELSTLNRLNSIVSNSNDPELASLYADWLEKSKLRNRYYENRQKSYNGELINNVEEEIQFLENSLKQKSQFLRNRNSSIKIEDVSNHLGKREVFIDILNVRGHYYSYIIKNKLKTPLIINLGSEIQFDSIYNYYKAYAIQKKGGKKFTEKDEVLGGICYANFWGKLDPVLKNVDKIYFSSDGLYNKINLNSLYCSEGKFLIDKYDISLLSNVEEFILLKNSQPKNDDENVIFTANLIGNPKFMLNDNFSSSEIESETRSYNFDTLLRGVSLKDLPGTKDEINEIANILQKQSWDVELFLESDATESKLKKMQSPQILHIATHGFFLENLYEIKNSKLDNIFDLDFLENPMLRSGLLFSGAANTIEGDMLTNDNGWLNAEEASLLDLSNTDLVVLSACNTGNGSIKNGKGVYGLQRAIKIAGAKTIIMSLWKVDDLATKELMINFYKFWLNEKNDIKTAFTRAQLELRDEYIHPYYWGAFVMIGR